MLKTQREIGVCVYTFKANSRMTLSMHAPHKIPGDVTQLGAYAQCIHGRVV